MSNTYDGTITLAQEGLTKRILDDLVISHLSGTLTPALNKPLIKYKGGDLPNNTFNYEPVLDILQYLEEHSMLDITYILSQCAIFFHYPKQSYIDALEMIGRYLKGTMNK